ncbi:hypothetical protein GN244_ATG16914 [Phytophthora infestans]|uniref:Uncharacterized protein n=1 Tax=Phytophthora infestans TaxID=4787 RepID=A0A833SPK0_PHYIN|nr:hypothetical protein GN244_ATG16914 [Phytophthora infestans]
MLLSISTTATLTTSHYTPALGIPTARQSSTPLTARQLSRSKKPSGNTAGLYTRGELRQCSDASSAESIRP